MDLNKYVDCKQLDKNLYNYSKKYKHAKPFPHIVIDNFLNEECIKDTLRGFTKVDWTSYSHFNEKKSGNKSKDFDPLLNNTIKFLNSKEFLRRLEKITGIKNLISDPELGSGGVHRSTRGGYLNIHADFTIHPYKKNWHRRVNVLVYLNEKWEDEWGGQLELWEQNMENCIQKISPIYNRCVIFNTDYDSFHGHPEPMTCPKNIFRKSIALYYYTEVENNVRAVSTNYRSRPKDKFFKKILIFFDKKLLSIFHFLKTNFKVSDILFTQLVDLFFKFKKILKRKITSIKKIFQEK